MKEKSAVAFILISLVIGVVFGAGLSYVVYRPQIVLLSGQVSDINSRLDSDLTQIESDVAGIKQASTDLEEEANLMESTLGSDIDRLSRNLEASESENKKSLQSIDSGLDEINSQLGNLESLINGLGLQIQNEGTIIDVYNNVSPAVVFITSTELTFDFQLQQEVPSQGVGSGAVVSPEGYILTNNHVVEGAETITVSFKPGEEIEATLIGTDPPTDLAVIKIDPLPDLPVASLGDSDNISVGMTAIAIGNPFSLERTVTVGVVSSVNRTLDAETGDIIFGIIQTDASVNPGNSGGPLVNSKGEVIGINSAIISPVRGSVGIGFAIPINTAKKVMTQLIEKGKVSRPYLGITGGTVSAFPPELGLPEKGVLIVDVIIDSPADKARLIGSGTDVQVGSMIYPFGGDVIISADNEQIDTIEALLEFLSKKEVGDAVIIGILRDNVESTVEVRLEERPE
jgi:S1-C subfamily serine protease